MKNSLTKPVKYGKIIAVQAILLTVAVHGAFFLLFSVPPVSHAQTEKTDNAVTLLNFQTSGAEASEFKKYIEKYAPSNFSNSSSPLGFGKFVSPVKVSLPQLPLLGKDDLHFTAAQRPVKYADLPSGVPSYNVLPRREIPKVTTDGNVKVAYPFAVSDSGKVIPLPLSVDELRMANEFPLNCGIYKLLNDKKSTMMPRFVLLQSSGRRSLDRLSMRLLYQEMKQLYDCADGEIFTVHYREHDAAAGGEL